MTKDQFFDAFGQIEPVYVFAVEEYLSENPKSTKLNSTRIIRTVLAAAVIAALLAMTAYASGLFGLIGRIIKEPGIGNQSEYSDDTGDILDSLRSIHHREYISLSGVSGSPEYQAAAEWLTFRASYEEQKAADQIEKGQPYYEWRDLERSFAESEEEKEICRFYKVWDAAMWDKLREIADKYDLLLHSKRETVIGDKGFQREHGVYEDDSFVISVKTQTENGPVFYDLYSERKGYLPCDDMAVSGSEEYAEWEYKNIYGQTVCIAMRDAGSNGAWIENEYLLFYSDENVTMTVKTVYGNQGNDLNYGAEEFAERLADCIDFGAAASASSPEEAIVILRGK